MKKDIICILLLSAFITSDIFSSDENKTKFDIQSSQKQLSLPTYTAVLIPSWMSVPVVDGIITEEIWSYADEESLLYGGIPDDIWNEKWTNYTDNLISWKAVWSEYTNKLYVAIKIKDDVRSQFDNSDPAKSYFFPYQDDCLELFTDGDNNGGSYEDSCYQAQQWFVTGENKIVLDDYPYPSQLHLYTGDDLITAATWDSNGDWICEAEFKIYNTFPTVRKILKRGDIIGWNIWYDDSDNDSMHVNRYYIIDHQVGWLYSGPANKDASYFGDLILGDAPPLSPPTLSSPSNDTFHVSSSPILKWHAVIEALSYRLQVSEYSDLRTTVFDESGITDTSKQVLLEGGTKYYWHVNATRDDTTTAWSELWHFTTTLDPPNLKSPADSSTDISASPTLEWERSSRADSYRLQVSQYWNFMTTFFDESGITATSKKINGLKDSTKYYWRVNATNAVETSDWSKEWNFTTIVLQKPPSPNLIYPPNDTTDISTSPTFTWKVSTGAESYRLQVSKISDFTTTVVDESRITATSKPVVGLENSTKYYWRVNATNSAGTSNWSEVWNFTTTSTRIPDAPSLSTPANGATEVSTTPTLAWNTSTGAKTYGLWLAVDSLFKKVIFNESGISATSRVITNLAYNSTYYWQVNASNDGGTGKWSKYWRFTTKSTIDLNYTVLFPELSNPSEYSPNDYKIIGLPGASDLSVKTVLVGSQNQDWQVYCDNGNESENPKDYLVAFDGTPDFVFKAGRAFWIIKKGSLNINYSVKAASLDDSGLVNIKLHDGWNLITNPFLLPVNWSKIEDFNNPIDPIWKYNGVENFTESDVFEPYIGYYFFANPDLDSLMIPYPHSKNLQKNSIYNNNFENGSWRIRISLSSGNFFDKTLSFGVSKQAKIGLDKLDFRKPRGVASVPTISFQRPEWDPYYSNFATDIRPEFEEMESWDFEVRGVHQQNSLLDFKGIEQIPGQMEVYLVDEGRGKSVNLREHPSYNFMGIGDIMKFRIVVGKSEVVKEKLSEINIPKIFALGNNYPNPFNSAATFPVEIPSVSNIELKIYNVLGQKIKSLFEGKIESGQFMFTWDGRDETGNQLSSGVYILILNTRTGISLNHKMILIR